MGGNDADHSLAIELVKCALGDVGQLLYDDLNDVTLYIGANPKDDDPSVSQH